MTCVPTPNCWIAYDSASTTRLSYAFRVDPSPLVASVAGEAPTMGSLQVVITNPTGAPVMVSSITFVVPVGTSRSLMQTTANVETAVSDTINWSFPAPGAATSSDTHNFTLRSNSGDGVPLDAGASVVIGIDQFQTVPAPTTAIITIKEILGSGSPNIGTISVTTFPAGFFFNGLTASVPSGSSLTPAAQVAANSAVTLTWNSSVVETARITILYSSASKGQQRTKPSEAGRWTSPRLTADTVFTVSVEASQTGGTPIVASMSVSVSVQNPELVAHSVDTGSINTGSATVTGTATLNGETKATSIAATGLAVKGATWLQDADLPLRVTSDRKFGATVIVESRDLEASINYSTSADVKWNVGVGGGFGPGVFFFWNTSTGPVVTISPSGMTVHQQLVIPRNLNSPKTPSVSNPKPGQILWDPFALWIYAGDRWLQVALRPPS